MTSDQNPEIESEAAPIGHGPRITRRRLLGLGLAGAATGLARRLSGQQPSGAPSAPAAVSAAEAPEAGVVILNARPLDAEAPLTALRTLETPLENFFVRSHHGTPPEMPARWTLTIDGEVSTPVELSLDEIRALPSVKRLVTTECSGNGRGRYRLPNTGGVQWGLGAVSTATWTGVPFSTLIERAGPKATAEHFWMEAADSGGPKVPKFLRSIPREVAMRDALLVWEMNGEPIPLLHGGPLRLLVPGWYGMASTKWLTHVHARPTESDNNFMAKGYRYGDGSPVERMRVKSLITTPLDGARIPIGSVPVAGVAWSGNGGIRQVEVSMDGGASWRPARLTGRDAATAWRTWEADLPIERAERHTLRVRATDVSGAMQPDVAATNPGGYGNNSIHEVRFDVVA
jgi:DMSO/TMAO reductase YedYZ molybdopterin-dependent catalytic subunit